MKKNIQERVAQLEIWDMLIYNFPSVFFCLFAGAWSDYNGRKLLLIIPFIGNILSYIAYMVNYYYFYELGTSRHRHR
jgi:MFS family permease